MYANWRPGSRNAVMPAGTVKFAIAEHAWNDHHPNPVGGGLSHGSCKGERELLLKAALHIHFTPEDQRLNRDVGLELPGCWVSTVGAICVKPHPSSSD